MPRTPLSIAGAVLAVGVLALSAAPAPASAQPAPGLIDALRRDLGLSAAQASDRVINEQRARDIEPALRGGLGDRFGGSWLTPSGTLVVATTHAGDVPAIAARGAQPKVVARPLARLDAIKAALDVADGREKVAAWYVDVVTNSVVVLAADPAAAEAFVRGSGVDASAVRVERSAERPAPYADIRGGDEIYVDGKGRCLVGFSVRQGAKQGFVTAGHCGANGALVRTHPGGPAIGKFESASFPRNDYAWASLYPGWNAIGYIKGGPSGQSPIRGATESYAGASVCSYSPVSGWRCGVIQQLNTSVTYPEGTVTGLTRTSVCSEPGSSGAPFVSGDQAQGVLSGGSGNCATGGTTYFQPIKGALTAFQLTLVTAPR
ncbi:S1 family peptidase [Spongiactinospora sp. 9N601]|uniref:S1 family peptidase n=1 Tax=Spongiactinospora sp. 9N601 TaxID=3375149 RepID=UPI0037B4BADA